MMLDIEIERWLCGAIFLTSGCTILGLLLADFNQEKKRNKDCKFSRFLLSALLDLF